MAKINLGKVVPQKGVDYYTEAEKTQLKTEIEQEIDSSKLAPMREQIQSLQEEQTTQGGAIETLQQTVGNQGESIEAIEQHNESQDADIEKLQTKVSNLEETVNSELEDGTAEGTEITVNDSATADGSLFPNGNTNQNQYEGYNLYNSDSYPVSTTTHGVTITNNRDGSFTLNGTCDTNNTFIPLGNSEILQQYSAESIITHTAYYVKGDCTKVSSSASACVIRLNYNDTNSMIPIEQLKNSLTISKTKQINTSTTGWSWVIRVDEGDTLNNFTIKYMLVKGAEELPYEPYVGGQASPSPTYTQPVHVLKGSNTIKVRNKNYMLIEMQSQQKAGLDIIVNKDKSFKIQGTTNNTSWQNVYIGHIDFKPLLDKQITISCGYRPALTANIGAITTRLYDADNNQLMANPFTLDANQSGKRTKTIYSTDFDTSNGVFLSCSIAIPQNLNKTVDIEGYLQIELGADATDYVEHKEQVKTLTLPAGMEMCKIDSTRDEFVKNLTTGKWYKNKKIAKIPLTGAEAGTYSWNKSTSFAGAYYRNQKGFGGAGLGNKLICDCLTFANNSSEFAIGKILNNNNYIFWFGDDTEYPTVESFTTMLANRYANNNPVILCYILETPVLEEITDTTLIAELDELYENLRTYYGQTNITVEAEDLAPMMTLNYKKSNRLIISEIDTIKARLDLLEG